MSINPHPTTRPLPCSPAPVAFALASRPRRVFFASRHPSSHVRVDFSPNVRRRRHRRRLHRLHPHLVSYTLAHRPPFPAARHSLEARLKPTPRRLRASLAPTSRSSSQWREARFPETARLDASLSVISTRTRTRMRLDARRSRRRLRLEWNWISFRRFAPPMGRRHRPTRRVSGRVCLGRHRARARTPCAVARGRIRRGEAWCEAAPAKADSVARARALEIGIEMSRGNGAITSFHHKKLPVVLNIVASLARKGGPHARCSSNMWFSGGKPTHALKKFSSMARCF